MQHKLFSRVLLVTTMLVVSCVGSGCSNANATVNDDKEKETSYKVNVAMGADEYVNYTQTNVQVVLNQLTSRMSTCKSVATNSLDADTEIVSTNLSIEAISEAISGLNLIVPPEQYMSNKDALIVVIKSVKSTLNDYISALESKSDVSDFSSKMMAEYVQLTSMINVSYK